MLKEWGNNSFLLIIFICFADGDPSNYLSYFKRAAVYLAIGQAKRAIPDLDRTIELKPDFSQVCASTCTDPFICNYLWYSICIGTPTTSQYITETRENRCCRTGFY